MRLFGRAGFRGPGYSEVSGNVPRAWVELTSQFKRNLVQHGTRGSRTGYSILEVVLPRQLWVLQGSFPNCGLSPCGQTMVPVGGGHRVTQAARHRRPALPSSGLEVLLLHHEGPLSGQS